MNRYTEQFTSLTKDLKDEHPKWGSEDCCKVALEFLHPDLHETAREANFHSLEDFLSWVFLNLLWRDLNLDENTL